MFEEKKLASRRAQREFHETQRAMNVFSERVEQNHRLAIVLPPPQLNFTSGHSSEVVTPPPSYDVITPPPTYNEVSDGFLFQPKT